MDTRQDRLIMIQFNSPLMCIYVGKGIRPDSGWIDP